MKTPQNEKVSSRDLVIFRGIGELQRQNPEIHQVLRMDPRKPFRYHYAEAKVTWRQGSMFAARSLSIIAAADYGVAVAVGYRFGPLIVRAIDRFESEFRNLRYVAAKR